MKKIYVLLLPAVLAIPLYGQQTFPVRFESGTEYFPENYPEVRKNPAVNANEIINGYYVRYVQCTQIPLATERAVLEAEGVQFIEYVSFGTYLTAIPKHFDLGKFEKIRVRSIVPVKTWWKLARSLREQPYGDWAVHGDWLDVNVQVYPHVSITQGAERCRQNGMTVRFEGNQNGFLQVRLLKDKLESAAALPWVRSLELVPPPSQPDDTRGRSLHRANGLDSDHTLGKKYNGEGVSILVRDDGPIGPHIDFKGRLSNLTGSGSDGNHGDGVGGIFAGAGNLDPSVKGMAAGATVYAIRYTPEFQDQTLPLHLNQNVTITNTSYSNGCNAGYTMAAQTVDQQLFQHPTLMHVFSAGNSNNISNCQSYGAGNQWGNITGGHKMAKNAIATANLNPDATLVSSSSRGPAYDGRLKPDISANGNEQASTDPNNAYITFSGTSAAAPGIAGCLAQLTHAYKQLTNGQEPETALLKAAILNTANDLGNTGPDFKFGWGHVNASRALRLLEENRFLWGQADHGQQITHTLQIPANVREARLMVYWADPPAAINADKALLNDLDLSVTATDDAIHLPWKLNPTPNAIILAQPAGRGRDSLNNTEQVVIENPVPGAYTVQINGAEVPFGPQEYVLVWEFLTEEVRITYPAGGEGFVPGETERIHWDAYGEQGTFSLRYSTDGGFSWQQIADLPGNQRMYDWQVPNVASGRVRLLLQRGLNSHTTELPLTIAPLPTEIEIEKVCPTFMRVSWKPANDTLSSQVYLLGNKYMEIKGNTASNTFDIPLQNGGSEQWVSVRAVGANGLTGRRAVAVQWPGELKNCIQPDDLGVRSIESPDETTKIRCSAFSIPVTIQLKNEGTNAVSGAMLNYQANNNPVVSQNVPVIPPGQTTIFTFQTPITVNANGPIDLKVWSTYAAEDAFFNDTLRRNFIAIVQPANGYFTEDFEGSDFPPFGWRITNPDAGFTWSKTGLNITGLDGQPTRAVFLNTFYYTSPGEEDYLDLMPMDLNGINKPAIAFDLAHVGDDNDGETLRVEVFPACDLEAPPVVVWEKSDLELATAAFTSASFTPNEAVDWRREVADLSGFAGQKIIIRFVSVNGPGNNIFLDNIGIVEYNISQPEAVFVAFADSICPGDTVLFAAAPTGGDFTNYDWHFGYLSEPVSASGPGPHTVSYLTAGDKNVRLIVYNALGADTILQIAKVLIAPSPNYAVQLDGLTATFTNSSQNALSYLWEFGDGNTSTAVNPVHTYLTPGNYTVKLLATNQCKTSTKSLNLPVTVGVEDLATRLGIRISPNPTAGDFRVEMDSQTDAGTIRFSLFDAQGRLIKEVETTVKQGFNQVTFENLQLPKGVYQLNVQAGNGWQGFAVVVQ
ncbi:MAG: hypothetical protein EPGJADBJ_00167 [Saprospiraceae bacterium]|nr:hypothetical protein [Saprospiraceae bacterium]